MTRLALSFASMLAVIAIALPAFACTLCDSTAGDAVRAGILTDFGPHLLATIAPFPVLIGAVVLLHRGWPWRSDA